MCEKYRNIIVEYTKPGWEIDRMCYRLTGCGSSTGNWTSLKIVCMGVNDSG